MDLLGISIPFLSDFMAGILWARILMAVFFGILFLQSGLDKVFQFQGNLDWLKGHFGKTFLKDMVPLMLISLTIIELAAGATSGVGAVILIFGGSSSIAYIGAILSGISLCMLFAGQRIAQDYAGASGIVPYFILSIFAMILLA